MFDPTHKHDTNPTWIFEGQGWVLTGLDKKKKFIKLKQTTISMTLNQPLTNQINLEWPLMLYWFNEIK